MKTVTNRTLMGGERIALNQLPKEKEKKHIDDQIKRILGIQTRFIIGGTEFWHSQQEFVFSMSQPCLLNFIFIQQRPNIL